MDNARNTDGTPYTGHYGGTGDAAKTLAAQQELAAGRILDQHELDANATPAQINRRRHLGLTARLMDGWKRHKDLIAEQSALIVGQRAAIEALRGWIQECADGVSNLGTRVAKLEDARLLARSNNHLSRINRLEAQADKCARFRAIHPPVTEEGNRD